jgi:hypothetical protein
MVIVFDTPAKSEKGILNNSGSCAAYVNYLSKEDGQRMEQGQHPEEWFSREHAEVHPAEVRYNIDRDHQGIGRNEGKFATGSINITAEEWQALGKTDDERLNNFKEWVKTEFQNELAGNYNKFDKQGNRIEISPENLNIYYKIEHDRHYKGNDREVIEGIRRQGETKDGFNLHCHFVLARKTLDGKNRISPTTNNRKEFDRDNFTHAVERNFDRYAGYDRPINQSYEYHKAMAHGKGVDKLNLIDRQMEREQAQGRQQEQKQEAQREKDTARTREQGNTSREAQRGEEDSKKRNNDFGLTI